jgi:hypothetical protein
MQKRFVFSGLSAVLFVLSLGVAQAADFPENPFLRDGNWYKANLHGHTIASDGKLTLEERAAEYRGAGYDIIATTDHRITSDVSKVCRDDFLVISGMETHPKTPNGKDYHFVALNVPQGLHFEDTVPYSEQLSKLKEAGASYFIAHPYWSGFGLEEFRPIAAGAIGVEVYNAGCEGMGRPYSSVHWDDLLGEGFIMPGFAVDDVHGKGIFGGWVMVKAPELSLDAVMAALNTGAFYASAGPVLEDVRLEENVMTVKCSPVKQIMFMSKRTKGFVKRAPNGGTMTEASWVVKPGLPWVRVEVIDKNGMHAWANPIDTSSITEE